MTGRRTSRTVTLVIDSAFENVSLVGVAIRGICHYLSLDQIASYHVELSAVEAVTNAVRHSYGGQSGHTIEIALSVSDDCLTITIGDSGTPLNHSEIEQLDFEPSETDSIPESGMGLALIHSLMDEASYETAGGKNTLTLKLYLKRSR